MKYLIFLCLLNFSSSLSAQSYSIKSLNINTEESEFLPKIESDSTLLFLRKSFIPKTKARITAWSYFPYSTSLIRYNFQTNKEIDTLLIKKRVFMDYIFNDTLKYFIDYNLFSEEYIMKKVIDISDYGNQNKYPSIFVWK